MIADRVLVVVLAALTFASFLWAVRAFFVRHGDMHPGMRLIAVGGLATMLAQTAAFAWAPAVPRSAAAIGVCMYLLSLVVFWSAVVAHQRRPPAIAFSDVAPHQLVTGGVYGVVRHPFYLAYTLAWIGGVAATGQLWLLASVFGMGVLYVQAASAEEAAFASGPFAEVYADYQARTRMFAPIPVTSSGPGATARGDRRPRPAP